MGVTERVWNAFTSVIKLEDRVTRQAEALKAQQAKIEDLSGRVIRLEAQLELTETGSSADPTTQVELTAPGSRACFQGPCLTQGEADSAPVAGGDARAARHQ